ncbi:hypothetical protein DFP78_104173 [Photobacterium lutimaris]|nr:hypothetical protein DFP78_104173 [Photobacterium lutimaris]
MCCNIILQLRPQRKGIVKYHSGLIVKLVIIVWGQPH